MRTGGVPFLVWILAALSLALGACRRGGHHHVAFRGTVVNGVGKGVAGATVYLIPTDLVDRTVITNAAVLSGEAEAYDEPLEDAADSGDPAILTTTTDRAGGFAFPTLPDGTYYVFVRPAPNDREHLPGGDRCRVARTAKELAAAPMRIELSGRPSPKAQPVGTSTCLVCHQDYFRNHRYTGHALGIRVPGVSSRLQDISKYPNFDAGLLKFTPAASYKDPGVTVLYYEDFDPTRGFDKFKVYEGAPGGGKVYLKVYLWREKNTGRYKVTLQNVLNANDPNSPVTFDVDLTYGGAVYKQRYLLRLPGRKGHYPFLQFQHEGDNRRYDPTRKVFRDYHADWFWDDTKKLLTLPKPAKTFEGNCLGCHAPGYRVWQDPVTGEWLADSVDDIGSNVDIDGDGRFDEVNVGCEKCHGFGSEHVAAKAAVRIVALDKISPSRANQVCGFCHDRIEGNGNGLVNDTPLDQQNRFPPPGIRRRDYLAQYVQRKAPKASSLWADLDAVHSKSHHQQFSDHLKSPHYRNARQLLVCADCHDTHDKKHPGMLRYSVSPTSPLCQRCHPMDVTAHMKKEVGTAMTGGVTSCVSCHMPKTAKTGAGRYGYLLGVPTGTKGDENLVFWENDISSHTMIVPSRLTILGRKPGQAMPVPYTNSCAICHTPAAIAGMNPFAASTCGACHRDLLHEWQQSPHAKLVTTVTNTTDPRWAQFCFRCHMGQRYVREQIAGDGAYKGALPYPGPAPATCTVCHYPHYGAGAEHRLRLAGRARLPEGPPQNPGAGTYVEAGAARVCVTCHNSRRSDPESDARAVWNSAAGAWRLQATPHAGNQGETYYGFGAVTSFSTGGLKEPLIPDAFHATPAFVLPKSDEYEACVTCHMYEGKTGKPYHEFEPVIEVCAECHRLDPDWAAWGGGNPPTFRKPARGDYDGDGAVEDVESEYQGLRARVRAALTDGKGSAIGKPEKGFGFTWLGAYPYWNLGTQKALPPDPDAVKAAWNYVLFAHDDGACFHNPSYAFRVLRATWTVLGRKLLQNASWTPPGDPWQDPTP